VVSENVVGGIGGESLLGRAYGGVDSFLGGVLPKGEKLGMESLGGAFGGLPGMAVEKMQGLLGSQTMDDQIGYQADVGRSQLREQFGGADTTGVDPTMLARVKQYMESGWAPDDTIDMDVWQMIGGQ